MKVNINRNIAVQSGRISKRNSQRNKTNRVLMNSFDADETLLITLTNNN